MKTKLLLSICALALTCTNVSAASGSNPIGEDDSPNTIHTTYILTGKKAIPGVVTLEVGKGHDFACNVEHVDKLNFTFHDVGHIYVDGAKLAKKYGLDLTCAKETYLSQYGSVALVFSLRSDPLSKTYAPSEPRSDIIHLIKD